MRPPELAALSTREFLVCVGGLTPEARFLQAWRAMPQHADTPDAIAGIFGAYLGEPL